jgi:MoxR-like ATPase
MARRHRTQITRLCRRLYVTLPDGWSIVAAGNLDSDRAVTTRMPTPLRNRFVHLDFEVDLQEWCEWAIRAVPLRKPRQARQKGARVTPSSFCNGFFLKENRIFGH